MTTTPATIIRQALLYNGISLAQTLYAEEMYRALEIVNNTLAQWNRKRWLLFQLQDVSFVSTGATTYSIGPWQDVNTPRPDKIEGGYARLLPESASTTVDFQLGVIESYKDFASIALKTVESFPVAVFLDAGFPNGTVRFWPVPPAGEFELHLVLKVQLTEFVSLQDAVNLPKEYEEALIFTLAGKLRPAMGLPPDPSIAGYEKNAMNTLRQANASVPTQQMPYGFTRRKVGNSAAWYYGGGLV